MTANPILQAFARWLGLTTALAAGLLIAWAADEARLCWQHGQCYESEPER